MMLIKAREETVDFILWLSVFFYLDPGGYIFNLWNLRYSKPLLLGIIWMCFMFGTNMKGIQFCMRDRSFRKIFFVTLIWFFYYLFVFLLVNNEYSSLTFTSKLIKTRMVLLGWLLFPPVYYFAAYRSGKLFLTIFSKLTILLSVLFLLKVFLSINLIFAREMDRGFINLTRIYLDGFGLFELGLYLLLTIIVIPRNFLYPKKHLLIYASVGVYLIYILSLTRRYIGFILIAAFISYIISSKVFKSGFKFNTRVIGVFSILIIVLLIFFRSYFFGMVAGMQTISFSEEGAYGSTYSRMSLFEQAPTIELFQDNMVFGTGYINEWYSDNEDIISTNLGVSASDYVFLSSTAMFGLFGLFLFLPLYFFLYRYIFRVLKLYKNNLEKIRANFLVYWPASVIFITMSLFFIRHLITYPDWFAFIGPHGVFEKYYIFLGLLIGSGHYIQMNIFYSEIIEKKTTSSISQ